MRKISEVEILSDVKVEKAVIYKPIIEFIPSNFDMDEWLQNQKLIGFERFSKDNLANMVSRLSTAPMYNKKHREFDRPFYSLSSKNMYSDCKDYKKYINLLMDGGVWESDYTYDIGKKSIGYRFTETYSNIPCKKYLNFKFGSCESYNFGEDIGTVSAGSDCSSTVNSLIGYLKTITLDYNSSISHLQADFSNGSIDVSKYNSCYCSLEKINNREFFAKQDEYGRLHTNLTNLAKHYRNYLTANGRKLISIDLKNSQPFFSTVLTKPSFWQKEYVDQGLNISNLNQSITEEIHNKEDIIMFTKSVEDNEDLLSYNSLVLNGSFYEFFFKALVADGINCKDRNDAKKSIFEIFFSKTSYLRWNKKAKVFLNLFPTVYHLFELIKQSSHNLLALILQGIESEVVINGIAKEFINTNPNVPIFTIHDSLVVPLKYYNSMRKNIHRYIYELIGYKPCLASEIFTAND